MMDKPRTGHAEKRRLRRNLLIVVAVLVVASISVGVSRLEPAAPTANRETLFFGTVQRGSMLREVRGPGTLVPVEVRWISVSVEGVVESIPALPGATVTPDTVLLELSNPEIEQGAFEAESQLRAGQADLENLRARLEGELLSQQALVAAAESQDEQAKLQVEADQRLFQEELIPELDLKLSRLRSAQLSKQSKIERQRYVQAQRSNQAQLSAQYARVAQLRALYDLRRREVESLKVRAGIPGVLQELPVEVGQRVPPGTTLARVARPEQLKAELRVPETQAKDVTAGLRASIDTRNGVIPGRVLRVAPSAQDGTVIVDVALEGPLPRGARPNLSIDGTIEIEKLDNVLYVSRPTFGQANSKVEMFKVIDDGSAAVRVPVQLGRTSVSTVEIINGLEVGDEVVLSDTSQYDGFDKIRLNG
ncbi:MAG TPA: HlyD family efflux transporter periplasmic adaptor subunit [Thermoanaerobaculia bacterium]